MPPKTNPNSRYWQAVRAAERKIIEYYLHEAKSVPGAAKLMEMDKAWLYRKMQALGIDNPYPKRRKSDPVEDVTPPEEIAVEDVEVPAPQEEIHSDA